MSQPAAPPRRAANVTLPTALLEEARALGVSLSRACESGLVAAVAEARTRQFLAENQAAMEAWNAHVAQHGLPLARFRQF